MLRPDSRDAQKLAWQIEQNLNKIFIAQFGHILTPDEWKALPFSTRREIDKLARQQAHHV